MATSRDQSQFSRRRSNTAQSTFRAMPSYPPLKVGESKVFHAWKHDPVKESPSVIFNQSLWQGVAEGDLLKLTNTNSTDDSESAFLFVVPKDEGNFKSQLQVGSCLNVFLLILSVCAQISLPAPIADAFGVRNYDDVLITKVSLLSHFMELSQSVQRSTGQAFVRITLSSPSKTSILGGTTCGALQNIFPDNACIRTKMSLSSAKRRPRFQKSTSGERRCVEFLVVVLCFRSW